MKQLTDEIYFVGDYKIEGVNKYHTLKQAQEYLSEQDVIGIDIETSRKYKKGKYVEKIYRGGLDPYLSNVVMLQMGTLDRVYVIDVRCFTKEEIVDFLSPFYYTNKHELVGHNLKFEGKHLKHKYNFRMRLVWDTMLCEMNLRNGLAVKYGLADLAGTYLGIKKKKENLLFDNRQKKRKVSLDDFYLEENDHAFTPFEIEEDFTLDKSTRLQFITIGNKPFTKEQVLYGADDITLPLMIRERQKIGRLLSDGTLYNPVNCHKIENSFGQVLADVELEGMGVDQQGWIELAQTNEAILTDRKTELEAYVMELYPQWAVLPGFFGHECAIEWSSPKQVINLFRKLNICPKEKSKQTGRIEWTVGAKAVSKVLTAENKVNYMYDSWKGFDKINGKYEEDHQRFMLAYLLVKKTEQAVTTFGRDWLKYIHPITGRVHSNYRQILNTGRMSSSNPNLQNIPGGKWRDLFITKEGKKFGCCDYSSQEIRISADRTGDEKFVDFFVLGDDFFGDDFHSYAATNVFRLKLKDDTLIVQPKDLPEGGKNPNFTSKDNTMRTNTKNTNFKINYGGSAFTLKDDFNCTLEEAEDFLKNYLKTFPGLEADFKRAKKDALEKGRVLIDSFSGRMWFAPYFKEMRHAKDHFNRELPSECRNWDLTDAQRREIRNEFFLLNPDVHDSWKKYFELKGKIERAGLNYRIQGTAGGMMKFAMNSLRHEVITKGYADLEIVNIVHDECLGEFPQDKADFYGELLGRHMVEAGKYFCKKVPMKADCEISDHWMH